jgi:hypothetical protein
VTHNESSLNKRNLSISADLLQEDFSANNSCYDETIVDEVSLDTGDSDITNQHTNNTEPVQNEVLHDDSLCVTPNVVINRVSVSNKQPRDTINQGEEKMAEVDTAMLSAEHGSIRHDIAVESARLGAQIGGEACAINKHIGDARFESAENFGHTRREQAAGFGDTRYNISENAGNIRREVASGFDKTGDLIMQEGQESIITTKDARADIADRITGASDRSTDRIMELRNLVGERFYTVGRDLSDLRQGQVTISKDIELNALRGIIEGQKNTQYLSDKIGDDGEKTRALINDLKFHDLNRSLVERNTELVNCEQDRGRYRDRYWDSRWDQNQNQFGAQFAAMQNQLQSLNQNFNSQLAETRQGMVNFGTMAGNAGQQSSTSNNVR